MSRGRTDHRDYADRTGFSGGAPAVSGFTYLDLARGLAVGTTMAYRYVREGLDVLAAMAP